MITNSVFFGVFVSLAAYEIGCMIKKRFKFGLFNPLLISIVIIVLILTALHVDYETYNEGAKYLSYLLTPATVSLAIPLYEQFEMLKNNAKAIMAGIIAGVLTSAICVLVISRLFNLGHEIYVTLLPKSITTAMGMSVSEELGGIVAITVVCIIITGIGGNVMAEFVMKLFRVTNPVAKGIGIGTGSHAIGTAKAIEIGEVEGAMSGLAIAVAGTLTVFAATIFAGFY